MTLNTETLSALRSVDRLDAIVKHLKSMPLAHRADAIETIQRGLRKRELTELMYNWPLRARDSQLPPEEDWDTWLILAGRGFGKTRTGVHRNRS